MNSESVNQNNLLVSDLDVEMLADSLSRRRKWPRTVSAGDTLQYQPELEFLIEHADELSYPLFKHPQMGFTIYV